MGSSSEEDEQFYWYFYYFWLPLLIFARTAQFDFYFVNKLVGVLIGDLAATAVFLYIFWQVYLVGLHVGMECLAIFR